MSAASEKKPRRHVRLYHPGATKAGLLPLNREQAHYLRAVLRMQAGDAVRVFDGTGHEWQARVEALGKKDGTLKVTAPLEPVPPSPLDLTLVQAVSKGDRMDTSIQKAVELGVRRIIPVFTQWGDVRLQGNRLLKKHRHWQHVAISACEQCGRADVPPVAMPMPLSEYLQQHTAHLGIFLDPRASTSLKSLVSRLPAPVHILIGPEGGFSDAEIATLRHHDLTGIRLGPRILRTETAGPAVIAALQAMAGDCA